jgi:hypothetical protein
MTKKTYKTMRGLASQIRQFTLSDFVTGRAYHKNLGWIEVKLSDELYEQMIQGFASALDMRKSYRLRYLHNTCGILRRVWVENGRFTYCAGQDYVGEVRFIKDWIRKQVYC